MHFLNQAWQDGNQVYIGRSKIFDITMPLEKQIVSDNEKNPV